MTGFQGYDQWKTASPYDDHDDEHCEVCGMDLADDPQEGTPAFEGFCSEACQAGYEHWQELCAVTEIGVTTSPKLWRPDCVRPMFELLCDELQRGSGDGQTDNVSRWSKSIYKGTACGAWLELADAETVKVGSIVEGIDQCADVQYMSWPFTSDEFWSAVQRVEDQCDELWKATHGCPDCFDYPEDELHRIDPNCPECKGEGAIF